MSSATSPSQRSAPTGSLYQPSCGRRPANGTRCTAASIRATCAGSMVRSGGSTSTHSYRRTGTPSTSAQGAPSTVRATIGAGTPAASAAVWNSTSSPSRSAGVAAKDVFTAHIPRDVASWATRPCSPRATVPVSAAPSPSPKMRAMAPARGSSITPRAYRYPTRSLNAGSARIGSKSESPAASPRNGSGARPIARRRCSIASPVRPARLSEHATL